MTERLYDENAYLSSFSAAVTACHETEDGYAVSLSRTAFFPEGGGQGGDRGRIGDASVRDTQEKDGEIWHMTDRPLTVGEVYDGTVDFALRFDRMQNHSAEHIVSGLVHRLYGLDNVGFHLGDEETTLDFNGRLDREALDRVEDLAGEAVFANLPILCTYPTPDELSSMPYRSKKELIGAVRIVSIPGYDTCACCAPHVARTGEIGMIKLLDFMHYKGGVRIRLAAGRRALQAFRARYENVAAISRVLSVPQEEASAGVDRLLAELAEKKEQMTALSLSLVEARIASLSPNGAGNILYFQTDADEFIARRTALAGAEKAAGVCAVFFPGEKGMRFFVSSFHVPLREKAPLLREKIAARGGGTDDLLQGSTTATQGEIEAFFARPL